MRTLFFGLLAFCALGLGGCWGPLLVETGAQLSAAANTHYWEAVLGKDTIQIKHIIPSSRPSKGLVVIGKQIGIIRPSKSTNFLLLPSLSENENLDTSYYARMDPDFGIYISSYESIQANGDFFGYGLATTLVFYDICMFEPLLDEEGKAYADSLHAAKQDTSIKFIQKPYNPNYRPYSD